MWSICRCMWSLVSAVCALRLWCVRRGIGTGQSVGCLSDCMPSPGQERQMARCHASILSMTRHPSHDLPNLDCHTMRIPHYLWGPVGGPARYLSGTRRQAPTRVSTPTWMVACWWGREKMRCCQVPGRQRRSVLVLAKCNYWAPATSKPERGMLGMHAVEVESL